MRALAADDPRVIGEYRLRARLGTGGMGRVYLGLSPAGRAVAVKIVHPDLALDTDFLRRFQQEIAAARAVSGIYTAPVVASGLNERPPWLATAFVPGPALDQVVSEHGPLPEAALWPLLAGLVEALQAIHAAGVVHRDLKPANVLLATDGPRVIDFGISRPADGTTLTAAGVVFGTPGYMSPEQAEGKPAGPASDVFALGCVIAYAATGAGPFGTGTAAAVLYRVVNAEAALDGVPPGLREIVAGCVAKDPAARPDPRTLAAAIAERDQGTGPYAVAFWPRSVASLIGAYQASLTQETKTPGQVPEDLSQAIGAYPPTPPSGQETGRGAHRAQQDAGGNGSSGSGWPPQPPWRGYPDPQAHPDPQGYRGYPGLQGPSAARGSSGPQSPSGSPGTPGSQGVSGSPEPSGSQGFPYQQGYTPTQGSPQPSRYGVYGGAPGSQAPPGGYLPAAGQARYPHSHRAGAAPVPLPGSVLNAVRLMYAGAAFTLIYAIGAIIVAGAIINNHPAFGPVQASSGRAALVGVAVTIVLASMIEIALWLGIAQACRSGKNWARVTGTVLFAIHTLGVLTVLANSHPDIGLTKLLTLVGWLIACAAMVFLWQPQSSAFFRAVALHR